MVEQDWDRSQPSSLRASRTHLMGSDSELSDLDDEDRDTIFSSADMLSPSGHSDAQTLALMLQEQLDAINEEIRLGLLKVTIWKSFFVIFDTMWPSVFIYHQLFGIHHCDGGVVTHLTCEDISQSTEVICISLKGRPIVDRLYNLFLVGETTNIRRNL